MKMERAYPPTKESQLFPPRLIGEQGCFILADAPSEKEREELETLAREAVYAHLSKGAPITDKTLKDAFEEAEMRLKAAGGTVSLLGIVCDEGASHCLVASKGNCQLLRVDGDQVAPALPNEKKRKLDEVYLAKIELGADEVLIALNEAAFKAQGLDSWKKRLASPETLVEEVQQALGKREGAIAWVLYPQEDSAPILPPRRRGLTFSVSLILLACLAILGTSVWMKERRNLLGRATPPSARAPEILVRQEPKVLASTHQVPEEWNFEQQELEIAQLRDAMQEVAEMGGEDNRLLREIISAQEAKIAQMAEKEAALAKKLESQEEYVSLLQSSLALLKEDTATPSDTLSLQLSEAIKSKEMLERELGAIATHTALLDQYREEIARLRLESEEVEETQQAYEELLSLCSTQSEDLALLENRLAEEQALLHQVKEDLQGRDQERLALSDRLQKIEQEREELLGQLSQEKQIAGVTQDQFFALAALSEAQEYQLAEYQETIEQLQQRLSAEAPLVQQCADLASQVERMKSEQALLTENAEVLQALLMDQENALADREEKMLELQSELERAAETLASAQQQLAQQQSALTEKEGLLASLQIGEHERALKLDETEEARALLTQQIDELTESHRLLHSEKRSLEARLEVMERSLHEKETRLAMVELEEQKMRDTMLMAEESKKALQGENKDLSKRIAALEKVELDYEKEHLLRRESDEMLSRLATNIAGWKEAVTTMEESRKALAEELAELKAYQSSVLKGKVQKAADRTGEKRPSVTRIHLVSPGETLEGIARRYYGTTRKVNEIREANEDLLSEGQQVRVGTALVIP
ncbi:MAG: tail protein X [Parachlamydiales bacterium]